jgi:GTPase SAR1 family protein
MEPFKASLVEGTSGVGKSTLIDALIRRHVDSAKPRRAEARTNSEANAALKRRSSTFWTQALNAGLARLVHRRGGGRGRPPDSRRDGGAATRLVL